MGPLSACVFAWTAAVVSASAHAIQRPRSAPAESTSAAPTSARVLVIRAVAGDDPTLVRALASVRDVVTTARLSVRVGVESERDGAYLTARRICAELSTAGLDARVVLTGARGPNRKADQLARILALEESPPDLIVVADGCVDLAGLRLDALIAPLADAAVGAVWAAPLEVAPRTAADRASAAVLDASLHAFALLARLDPRGMVGKLFALKRETLASVGGFASLVDVLGEDMELARRLDARGLEIRLAPVCARSLAGGRSFGDVIARFARWVTVIRAQRPHLLVSYPFLFCATPLLTVASLVAAFVEGPIVLLAAALAGGTRLAVALAAKRASGQAVTFRELAFDVPLADAVLFSAFVRSLASRDFAWRGRGMRIAAGGKLTSLLAADEPSTLVVTKERS